MRLSANRPRVLRTALTLSLAALCLAPSLAQARQPAEARQSGKPRVLVLTDIENEPDDAQSLVRFLVYSNQWDIEGLVATTSVHLPDRVAPERIRRIVQAYGKVRGNLLLHEKGFPTAAKLLSLIRAGLPLYGLKGVGEGKDSPGSQRLIEAVDRADDRPLWVLVWGGPNVLAQALWRVERDRSPEELARFVAKLRVYTISDQDDTGPWIRTRFPGLFYIASPGVHAGGAYHASTWSGISGDKFHGRFVGADFAIVDNPWLDANVRAKGPLGAEYPHTEFIMEGDTPSFLYLIDNGLGSPEHPDWGSWGGRYEWYTPRTRKWFLQPETRPFWADGEDEVLGVDGQWHTSNKATIWRWRAAYQNDFAARMDWTIRPYKDANHPPDRPARPSRPADRPAGRDHPACRHRLARSRWGPARISLVPLSRTRHLHGFVGQGRRADRDRDRCRRLGRRYDPDDARAAQRHAAPDPRSDRQRQPAADALSPGDRERDRLTLGHHVDDDSLVAGQARRAVVGHGQDDVHRAGAGAHHAIPLDH